MKSGKLKLISVVVFILAGVVLYRMNSQDEVTQTPSDTAVNTQTTPVTKGLDDGESHAHEHGNFSHPDVKAAPVKAMDSQEREQYIEKSFCRCL